MLEDTANHGTVIRIAVRDGQKVVTAHDCTQVGDQVGYSIPLPASLPFDWDDLAESTVTLLSDLLRAIAQEGFVSDRGTGPLTGTTIRAIEDVLGGHLYGLLFGDQTGVLLTNALRRMDEGKIGLIRIELEFAGKDASVLNTLPWEYLRIPDHSRLADRSQLILNRRLYSPDDAIRSLTTGDEQLRILIIAPSPPLAEVGADKQPLAPVTADDVERELARIKEALGDQITFEVLSDPPMGGRREDYKPRVTSEALWEAMHSPGSRPHVLHFIGHGKRDADGRGKLALSGVNARPDWIDESDFADAVCENHDLRLVILQACESALPSPYFHSFSGVAATIAARRIPAVVAMQYSITATEASTFANEFYNEVLLKKEPVDVAVTRARSKMLRTSRQMHPGERSVALPVVYVLDYHQLIGQQDRPPRSITPPPRPVEPTVPCVRCRRRNLESAVRCGYCRLEFECPECGKRWDPLAKYCTMCPRRPDPVKVNQPPWPEEPETVAIATAGAQLSESSFDG